MPVAAREPTQGVTAAPPHRLPAGPRGGRLADTVAFHRDPLGFLRRARSRHGDVFTIRLATGSPIVVVCDPREVRGLADSDPADAGAGAARRTILPMASPLSVFGADGAEHAAARARIEPAFAPGYVAGRSTAIAAIARRHVAGWPRGRPMRLLARMRALADEVFAREVLGLDGEGRARELAQATRAMLRTPGNPPISIPGPDDGAAGAAVHALFRRRRRRVAAVLEGEIADRRSRGRPGGGALGLLLADEPGRPAEELIDELLAVLMAAQEPIASALTWLALRAHSSAEVSERLRAEGARSPYGAAVIAETLRLNPPAAGVLRRLLRPAEVAGHLLPAGTTLMVPIAILHRDPGTVPDADRFLPERHLPPADGHLRPATDAEGPRPAAGAGGPHGARGRPEGGRAALVPFGGGTRRCLGEAVALLELETVLDELLASLSLRPLGPQPERMVLRATILVPQRSGLALARPR